MQEQNTQQLINHLCYVRSLVKEYHKKIDYVEKVMEYTKHFDYFDKADVIRFGQYRKQINDELSDSILMDVFDQADFEKTYGENTAYLNNNLIGLLENMLVQMRHIISDFSFNAHKYFMKRIEFKEITSKQLYRVNTGYSIYEIGVHGDVFKEYIYFLNIEGSDFKEEKTSYIYTLQNLIDRYHEPHSPKHMKEYMNLYFSDELV